MKKGIAVFKRGGFTLIEVLVTVVVIGVLAAVVIPAVTSQVTAGDSSRVISDLNNVRTGIENFDIAVRQFPGDVDDLVNRPGTSASSGTDLDKDVSGVTYADPTKWAGPYVEASLPASVTSTTTANPSATAFTSGYASTVNNRFLQCKITDTAASCTTTTPEYVAVELDNLTAAQLSTLNDAIDGVNETNSSTAGKFRASGTTVGIYYATPFK